jgi:mevalonate kinase
MNVYIEIGRVLEAHNNRFYVRQKNRQNPSNVDVALRDYHNFGMYEDCGDFYKEEYERAKENARTFLSMKVSAEKHYKKMYLTFKETYPDFITELDYLVSKQAKQHSDLINKQIADAINVKNKQELERKMRLYPWRYNPDGTRRKGY